MSVAPTGPVRRGFRTDHEKVFVKPWSPYFGALLLVLLIVGLVIKGQIWGVFGGVEFRGDWINQAIGLGPLLGLLVQLDDLLSHRISLMNAAPVLGGWGPSLLCGGALLLAWSAWVRYNESTEKFTLI